MCLEKVRDQIQIATEDIVVYKYVHPILHINLDTLEDGMEFEGILNDHSCKGKIHIHGDTLWFCTNNKNLDGKMSPIKHGFYYSWVMDFSANFIKINNISFSLDNTTEFLTPYRNVKISMGETYVSDLVKEDTGVNIGIHSFKSLDDIISHTKKLMKNTVIIKCIIPKNSTYYIGENNNYINYASNAITYVEKVIL